MDNELTVVILIGKLYGNPEFVEERHRHRYEVNDCTCSCTCTWHVLYMCCLDKSSINIKFWKWRYELYWSRCERTKNGNNGDIRWVTIATIFKLTTPLLIRSPILCWCTISPRVPHAPNVSFSTLSRSYLSSMWKISCKWIQYMYLYKYMWWFYWDLA